MAILGGIGSGKSSASGVFAELGACVIDADVVGHFVLNGEARDAIASIWPETVQDNVVDRGRLATIVFADPSELRRLESVTRPLIRTRISELVAACTSPIVVVELSVLADMLEGNWLRVVVDAPDDVRLDRVLKRGMSIDDARARMKVQASRIEWMQDANVIIDNRGDESELRAQIQALVGLIGCGTSLAAAGEAGAIPPEPGDSGPVESERQEDN